MCCRITGAAQIGEVFVNTGGGSAAIGDRPDDEGLAAFDVARSEDTGDVRHFVCINGHEAFGVQGQSEL